jgi:hypothetical protein
VLATHLLDGLFRPAVGQALVNDVGGGGGSGGCFALVRRLFLGGLGLVEDDVDGAEPVKERTG